MKNKNLLMFLLIFLTFYQDFPLVRYFGEIARSPIVFISPLLLLYIFCQKKINLSKNVLVFFYYLVYLILISFIYIIIIYIKEKSFIVLDENIVIKSIKMSIYPIVSFIVYWFFTSFFNNNKKNYLDILYSAFKLLQKLFLLLLFIEIFYLKYSISAFLPFLHETSEKYWRIRLLTYEESWTGTIIVLLVFFPIYLANHLRKTKKEKLYIYIFSSLMFLSYLLFSLSKGFLLLVLTSIAPLIIINLYSEKKLKPYRFIFSIFILISFIFILYNFFYIVQQEFYKSGTFGTRFTSIISSLKIFIYNPFGVGWSGMIYYYPKSIQEIIDSKLFDSFNLLEIRQYITSSKSLSTKTDFLDNLMEGGLFFLFFYYNFFIKKYIALIKRKENIFLKIILLYMILAGATYITYHIKYEIWFFVAFIESILYKKTKINNE